MGRTDPVGHGGSHAARIGDTGRRAGERAGSAAASATRTRDANAIWVSRRQTGNPVLKYIRNARWCFVDDLVPDYQMGSSTVCLFLSLKYHLLHPGYIHYRIRALQKAFRLRVVLVHVDVEDPVKPLASITKLAILSDLTLICGWTYEECARYIETYRVYDQKKPDALHGRPGAAGQDYASRVTSALTQIRGVNRTDALTLASNFDSLGTILQAGVEDLRACPGLGPTKVKRMHEAFHAKFWPDKGPKGKQGNTRVSP